MRGAYRGAVDDIVDNVVWKSRISGYWAGDDPAEKEKPRTSWKRTSKGILKFGGILWIERIPCIKISILYEVALKFEALPSMSSDELILRLCIGLDSDLMKAADYNKELLRASTIDDQTHELNNCLAFVSRWNGVRRSMEMGDEDVSFRQTHSLFYAKPINFFSSHAPDGDEGGDIWCQASNKMWEIFLLIIGDTTKPKNGILPIDRCFELWIHALAPTFRHFFCSFNLLPILLALSNWIRCPYTWYTSFGTQLCCPAHFMVLVPAVARELEPQSECLSLTIVLVKVSLSVASWINRHFQQCNPWRILHFLKILMLLALFP